MKGIVAFGHNEDKDAVYLVKNATHLSQRDVSEFAIRSSKVIGPLLKCLGFTNLNE